MDEKVRLVVFPHCSNVVGEINDVPAITEVCHSTGAFVCVDGVSYAPHGIPDVGALGPDVYLFSAYKTYGPHQGIMAIRRAFGDAVCRTKGTISTARCYTNGSPQRVLIMHKSRPVQVWRIMPRH